MGSRGKREITRTTAYTEPDLMKGIDDLQKQARENGCYDGDKLDVEKLVDYVSRSNPDEPIKLVYVQMERATSGSLTYEKDTWIIRVNKNHNSKRQRCIVINCSHLRMRYSFVQGLLLILNFVLMSLLRYYLCQRIVCERPLVRV